MKLVENWRAVLRRSFAVWLAVASALLGAVEVWHADLVALFEVARPFLDDNEAGKLSALLAAVIPVARIIRQVSISAAEAAEEKRDA